MGGPYYHRIAKWLYFPGSMANAEKIQRGIFGNDRATHSPKISENATVLKQKVR
jgi:hypothetical protein